MISNDINERGLVMLGCGKMGSAMLRGWLAAGLSPAATTILDPTPPDWLSEDEAFRVNGSLPKDPSVAIIAVKPQIMADAVQSLAGLGGGSTLFVSVAAGIRLAAYEAALGTSSPIIRAMPNTPAAVGKGITALVGNAAVTEDQLQIAETLLSAVGTTVRLPLEEQMDAVTGVSGSGPAYVFHMIEALAAAGEAQGLSPDLAMDLARATVSGAGALAGEASESAAQLRINVTSPAGTTAAGLDVLMPELTDLMTRTVAAASDRSRELSQ